MIFLIDEIVKLPIILMSCINKNLK